MPGRKAGHFVFGARKPHGNAVLDSDTNNIRHGRACPGHPRLV